METTVNANRQSTKSANRQSSNKYLFNVAVSYRASKAIVNLPCIAPCIEHEDYIHFAMVYNDEVCYFISYIWDTREIVRISEHLTIDDLRSDFADWSEVSNALWDEPTNHAVDDMTRLHTISPNTYDKFYMIIDIANESGYTEKPVYKLKRTKINDATNTIDYSVNGELICRTRGFMGQFGPEHKIQYIKDTMWLFDNLTKVFGQYDKDITSHIADIENGKNGERFSRKQIIEVLESTFDCIVK